MPPKASGEAKTLLVLASICMELFQGLFLLLLETTDIVPATKASLHAEKWNGGRSGQEGASPGQVEADFSGQEGASRHSLATQGWFGLIMLPDTAEATEDTRAFAWEPGGGRLCRNLDLHEQIKVQFKGIIQIGVGQAGALQSGSHSSPLQLLSADSCKLHTGNVKKLDNYQQLAGEFQPYMGCNKKTNQLENKKYDSDGPYRALLEAGLQWSSPNPGMCMWDEAACSHPFVSPEEGQQQQGKQTRSPPATHFLDPASDQEPGFTVLTRSSSRALLPRCCQLGSPEFARLLAGLAGKADPGAANPAVRGVRPGTAAHEETQPRSPHEIYTDMGGGELGGRALAPGKGFDFSNDGTELLRAAQGASEGT
ncbi:hypothetical protein Anapl_00930 [Anas platyrhynchos]|uniref:Uncharacterized protein n=1 Tax=Anas platyrhynchos TaxID=8839 RepID=R0LAZ8_ANAPL|nr:hypothetical protein Anapl_00930 [Anas platyrhynchos]